MRYNTQKRAKKSGNVYISHGFEKAFYNLNPDQMNQVQDILMKELAWSVTRFYNRMRGVYSFSEREIEVVAREFKMFGLDAWTGDRTFINTAEYECKKVE